MKKIKFLHCADIHLDAPLTSLGSGNGKSSMRRRELKETFGNIICLAKEEKVDLLLISGDLYEHEYVKKSTINYVRDMLNEIPDKDVFIVPGNHDPYTADSYYRSFKWGDRVHILTSENPCVCLEDMGVCIYGSGFNSFYEANSLVGSLKAADQSKFNILLAHGTVDMDFMNSSYNPMSSKELNELNMDYIALGHFHNISEKLGRSGNIFNPGSPEPLGFDETGAHGVFLGTLERSAEGIKTLDVNFVKLNKRHYEDVYINIDGCNNDEKIIKKVMDELYSMDMPGRLFCVTLKGYVESGFHIDTSHIESCLEDKCFFIKIRNETSIDYDFDSIVKEPGLKGLFARKVFERIEKAGDEHEKKLLMKSLYYGIQALEQGKVEVG